MKYLICTSDGMTISVEASDATVIDGCLVLSLTEGVMALAASAWTSCRPEDAEFTYGPMGWKQ